MRTISSFDVTDAMTQAEATVLAAEINQTVGRIGAMDAAWAAQSPNVAAIWRVMMWTPFADEPQIIRSRSRWDEHPCNPSRMEAAS